MKVAFPLRNKKELAIDFVRCESIGVYDQSSRKLEYLPYSSSNELLDQIKAIGAECVVSPYFSCIALQTFREGNIETYKARSEAIEDNMNGLFSRMLHLFSVYDTLLEGECPKDCSGCKYKI